MNTPDTIELGGFTFVRHPRSDAETPGWWLGKLGPSIFMMGSKYVAQFRVGPAQITFESPTPEGLNQAWGQAVQDTRAALDALFEPAKPPATAWDPKIAVVTKEK